MSVTINNSFNAYEALSRLQRSSSSTGTSASRFTQALTSTSSNAANFTSSFENGPPRGAPPFLAAAAKKLGLSTDELDQKLRSGASLSDVAKEQGVSSTDLQSAIADDFKTHTGATDAQASAVAEQIMQGPPARPGSSNSTSSSSTSDTSSTEGVGGHRGHKPPFLDAAAKSLGLSSDELDQKLRSGESLTQVAQERGVSTDTVTSAIAADFQAKHPDATASEASQVAAQALEGPPQGQASLQSFRVNDLRLRELSPA